MSKVMYVVVPEDIDIERVDVPSYASIETPAHGHSRVAKVWGTRKACEDTFQAFRAVYPEAKKTARLELAGAWANEWQSGRVQLGTGVSPETRAQADELVAHGYSLRDVLTLGVEMLHREKLHGDKEPLRELVNYRLSEVGEGLRMQDLDHLQDAIEIRRNEILAARLEKRGIPTRTKKVFDDGEAYHFSYVLVYDPAGDLPGEWADRAEARRLIDTVRNLAPAEAFRRWHEKVVPLAHERYTRGEALRDAQKERDLADEMYRDGEIDSEMHRIMHEDARDYLDLAEDRG